VVANILGQLSYAHGPICSVFPNHRDGTWATPACIWAISAAARASERNIGLAIGSGVVGSMQWENTPIVILQQAAQCLTHTKSGLAYAWLAGIGDHEIRQSADLMELACRLSRDDAMELARKILGRIDELAPKFERSTRTPTFRDFYDLETLEPLEEHRAVSEQGREELARLGVPLP
jgi:hypothetical protein